MQVSQLIKGELNMHVRIHHLELEEDLIIVIQSLFPEQNTFIWVITFLQCLRLLASHILLRINANSAKTGITEEPVRICKDVLVGVRQE